METSESVAARPAEATVGGTGGRVRGVQVAPTAAPGSAPRTARAPPPGDVRVVLGRGNGGG